MPHVHAPSALPRQLRAEAVSLTFSGVRALKSVSLSLERGRVLGLIGPNGAGKTTMVNVICRRACERAAVHAIASTTRLLP